MLEPAIDRLRRDGVTHLAVYGTALWLPPALLQAGFERREWIISLERHPRPAVRSASRAGRCTVRCSPTTWAGWPRWTRPSSSRPTNWPAAS